MTTEMTRGLSGDYWSDPPADHDEDPRAVCNFTTWWKPVVTERDRQLAAMLLYEPAVSRC